MSVFETPRLHMRPLGETDEALYCHLHTDPEVMRHIGAPMSAEAAQRSFRAACRLATREGAAAQRWVVAEHGSAAAIGLLALIGDEAAADQAEVGLMLRPDRQRRGVAVAAIGAIADWAFDPACSDGPDLRLLWTRHAPDNVAAMRLMRRMAFLRQDPRSPDPDEIRWQMPRDRWHAHRGIAADVAETPADR